MPIRLMIEEQPNPDDVAAVRDGRYAFNVPYAGDGAPRDLNAFVRDEAGVVIGGLRGGTAWRYLHVGIHLGCGGPPQSGARYRTDGRGEAEAAARGCLYAHLDTFSY